MPSPGPIDLRLLTYFLATAEAGGISRAAAELNLAQPTLSKAIRLLEHQLGVTLFERLPHGVVPTPVGRRLLAHARIVTTQVRDAAQEVEALRTGRVGRVRIGAGPSWLRRVLPEAVARALAERPGLTVELRGGFDERLLHDLAVGELDMVVAESPQGHDDVDVEPLTRDRLAVFARADHPLAGGRAEIAALLEQPWALPPPHTLARRKLDGRLVSLGWPVPRRVTVSDSLTFILALVRASDALTYTTTSMIRAPEGAGLVEIDAPEIATSREAGLILRRPRLLSPGAEFVARTLTEACRADPVN